LIPIWLKKQVVARDRLLKVLGQKPQRNLGLWARLVGFIAEGGRNEGMCKRGRMDGNTEINVSGAVGAWWRETSGMGDTPYGYGSVEPSSADEKKMLFCCWGAKKLEDVVFVAWNDEEKGNAIFWKGSAVGSSTWVGI
jgi:hypothetical protein